MSVSTDLRAFILADGTVAGLIGTRLYPLTLPQAPTLPAMSYQWISGQHFNAMDAPSKLSGPRVQFTCWAATYLQAEAVVEALRKRLNGFRGMAGATEIQGAFMESERDLYESDPALFARSADFFVYYTDT
jgi:hypothetical protein